MVRPWQCAFFGEVPLDNARPERRCRGADRDAALVARIADKHVVALPQCVHHPQIDVDEFTRVGRRALQQDELVRVAQDPLDRLVDVFERAHARRDDHGSLLPSDVVQKGEVGEHRRGRLDRWHVQSIEQVGTASIPGAAHELEGQAVRQITQAIPIGLGQLQLEAVLTVRCAERVGVNIRSVERGAGQQLVDRALLKLDRVSLAVGGDAHQVSGKQGITVVVDPTLGDDEAWLAIAHHAPTDGDGACAHQAVQPPSTMRFAPVM